MRATLLSSLLVVAAAAPLAARGPASSVPELWGLRELGDAQYDRLFPRRIEVSAGVRF